MVELLFVVKLLIFVVGDGIVCIGVNDVLLCVVEFFGVRVFLEGFVYWLNFFIGY